MKKWNIKNTVGFIMDIEEGSVINGAILRESSLQSIFDNYSHVPIYLSGMDMDMFKSTGEINSKRYEIGNTRSVDIVGGNKNLAIIRGRIAKNAYEMIRSGSATLKPEFVFKRICEIGAVPIAEDMKLVSIRFMRVPGKKNNYSL